MFQVVRSLTRRYGWSIQAPPGTTWVIGPCRTFGWYRYKRDAIARADAFNRAGVQP
jgi:hypothetical protein